MKIYKANDRGQTKLDWLDSKHSFSFGDYINPEIVHFGALRVLNDDAIDPGKGFGLHPHNNMEIITIVLNGEIEHYDTSGNKGLIKKDEIQVMSAGTGIYHSEFNASKSDIAEILQIWIFPKEKNILPGYDQMKLNIDQAKNKFYMVVSGLEDNTNGLYIHQLASLSLCTLDTGNEIFYTLNKEGNGIFLFLIEGEILVENEIISKRDAITFKVLNEPLKINASSNSKLLIIEVPMNY